MNLMLNESDIGHVWEFKIGAITGLEGAVVCLSATQVNVINAPDNNADWPPIVTKGLSATQ